MGMVVPNPGRQMGTEIYILSRNRFPEHAQLKVTESREGLCYN